MLCDWIPFIIMLLSILDMQEFYYGLNTKFQTINLSSQPNTLNLLKTEIWKAIYFVVFVIKSHSFVE